MMTYAGRDMLECNRAFFSFQIEYKVAWKASLSIRETFRLGEGDLSQRNMS